MLPPNRKQSHFALSASFQVRWNIARIVCVGLDIKSKSPCARRGDGTR